MLVSNDATEENKVMKFGPVNTSGRSGHLCRDCRCPGQRASSLGKDRQEGQAPGEDARMSGLGPPPPPEEPRRPVLEDIARPSAFFTRPWPGWGPEQSLNPRQEKP